MDWLDMGLVKFSCIVFGIILAALLPELREINLWWLLLAVLVLAIRPLYRVYLR